MTEEFLYILGCVNCVTSKYKVEEYVGEDRVSCGSTGVQCTLRERETGFRPRSGEHVVSVYLQFEIRY